MRIRGGTAALINLIAGGRLDPVDGLHEEERLPGALKQNGSDRRARLRRERYHAAKDQDRVRELVAARAPF
jgi:hypothetical protein